jgi:hypothetical protein
MEHQEGEQQPALAPAQVVLEPPSLELDRQTSTDPDPGASQDPEP